MHIRKNLIESTYFSLYICNCNYFINEVCWNLGLGFCDFEAKKYGIGGRARYVHWAKNVEEKVSKDDDFYTNAVIKGYYKNHVLVRL